MVRRVEKRKKIEEEMDHEKNGYRVKNKKRREMYEGEMKEVERESERKEKHYSQMKTTFPKDSPDII